MKSQNKVVISQRYLTHYRVPLFEKLHEELNARDINLVLVHGQPAPNELKKNDQGCIEWANKVNNHYYHVGDNYLVWQPLLSLVKDASLLVLTQENRILSNYFHLIRRQLYRPKIAFWGHGANLQSDNPNGLKESFKRFTTTKVDWWFAYTDMSADLVRNTGYPKENITTINNTIDTSSLEKYKKIITDEEITGLKNSIGIRHGSIAIFVGSLYSDKRLDFLFKSAVAIKAEIKDFQIIIIGDGPQRELVEQWCSLHSWVYWVGTRFGKEKALFLKMSQVMLNPGLVGLGILDSFVFEVPLITTDCGIHSPEISYLESGTNGIITENELQAYKSTIIKLLKSEDQMAQLRKGCANSSKKYTIENMAKLFASGIQSATES